MSRHVRVLLVVAAALALLVTGAAPAGARGDEQPKLSGRVTVFAATSLPAVFEEVASDFRQKHPAVRVKLVFRASGVLAEEIQEGADADVFAPADQDSMTDVADQVRRSTDFAGNQLEIAVQEGNPKGIQSLADLGNPGVSVALCSVDTGCGEYADQALANANVQLTPASRHPDVAKTLAQVQDGNADAAIVYVTDVISAEQVTGVSIPDAQNVTATYPIAVLQQSSNRKAARAFVAYVLSTRGQLTLQEFGFLAP